MSDDPNRPFFTIDFMMPKTRNRDILLAYINGSIDRRWFKYLLPYINFRASLPPPRYLSIYTWAFTIGMTLPLHPFVKDFCYLHGISPTQLALNFWYYLAGMWVLWHQDFDLELSLDEFLYVHKLCHIPKSEGWYFLGSHGRFKPILGKFIRGTSSSSHAWKPMFLVVQGCFNLYRLIAGLGVEGCKLYLGD